MVANSGRLQIIGLRAVLYDVGKYLQEGKRLEDADKRISRAMDNVALTSIRTSEKITGLQTRLAASRARDIKLSQEAAKAFVQAEADRIAALTKSAAAARAIQASGATAGALNPAGLQLGPAAQGAAAQAQINQTAAANAAAASTAAQVAANKSMAAAVDKTEKALVAKAATTAIDTKLMNANTEAGIRNTNAQHRLAEAIQARNITPIQRLKAVAPAAAGIAAIGAGIFTAASISQAAKYQDSLTKIDNLTNLTTEDTQKLRQSILEMTKTIPKSPGDLGGAAYEILSRGITNLKEAEDILTQSAKASVAGFGDIKQIAITTTSIINAYGKENIDAAQALDILFATVKEGGGEFNDYAQNIGRVAQISRSLGVTFDQVGAAIAVLTNVGLPANQATTALLGILNQIASPSKEAEKALLAAGSSIQELRANIRDQGLLPALQQMLKLFGNNVEIIETLFPEVRGFSGALALLAEDSEKFNRAQGKIANSVGIVDDAFKNTKTNFNAVAQTLRNTLTRALIQFGTAILPTVTVGLKLLNDILPAIGFGFELLGKFIKNTIDGVITNVNFMIRALIAAINNARGPLNSLIDVTNAVNPFKIAGKIPNIPQLGDATVGSLLGLDDLNKNLDKTGETANRANQNLGKIPPAFTDVSLAASKLQKDMEDLVEEFQKASQTAGTVDSSFDATGLFASVSKELQKVLKVSDFQAGQIQGANAVTSASARAASEQSNYARVMGTMAEVSRQVAAGVSGATSALRQLVNALARTALETQQALADAVFARPTREVADLSLDLARNRQQNFAPSRSNDAQIRALQDKLDALNKQAERAQQSAKASQAAQQKQLQVGSNQARAASENQQKASESIVDQLRISNLIARQTYERLDENFGRLIDANTQQQSTLQETFRKQNAEFSRQILEATGKGDITTALDLSKQQREASKAYVVNAANLVKVNDQLQIQQKEAARVEAERQRQAELAEALAQATQKQTSATETQTGAAENQTGATETQTEAVDKATSAIDAQKEKIQSQIDSLTKQNETIELSSKSIEDQIAAYQANTDVQKAAVIAADQTLLSEQEQATAIQDIIGKIHEASGVMRQTTKNILDLLPGNVAEDARKAWNEFLLGMKAATDPGFVNFNSGIDAVVLNAQLLAGNLKTTGEALSDLTKRQADAVAEAEAIISRSQDKVGNAAANVVTNFNRAKDGAFALGDSSFRASRKVVDFGSSLDTTAKRFNESIDKITQNINIVPSNNAEGGFYNKPTLTMVGETHQRELILPLERPARARQLLAQIPPSLMATLRPTGGSQTVFAPNITVTGETLDAMEGAAIRAVQHAFRDARSSSSRQGGLLTSGLGPAALRS